MSLITCKETPFYTKKIDKTVEVTWEENSHAGYGSLSHSISVASLTWSESELPVKCEPSLVSSYR